MNVWRALLGCAVACSAAHGQSEAEFARVVLSEHFYSEGADFGDFNGDGAMDVVSGPFWYAGPDFTARHRYMAGGRISIKAYSPHFFSFAHDFNRDGQGDILVIGMPGQGAAWYENPGAGQGTWARHKVLADVGNESPTLTDVTGDGRLELVLVHGGRLGIASPDPSDPRKEWTFRAISSREGYGAFTHGLGVGDVDGDGRMDILETAGWHQQSPDGRGLFRFHAARFSESGGAQMHVVDFDADGDGDVLAVQNAHGWGLSWFERRGRGDDFLWVKHDILTANPADHPSQLAISQMHALAVADVDGDGAQDIITGKRFFAHGGGDPGAFQLPLLLWLRTVRERGRVRFDPHVIDQRVGVGTQLTVGDVDRDGDVDILVGNKLGTHLLRNQGTFSTAPRYRPNLAGTADFSLGVRTTDPRTPEEERRSFVLPPGFEATLVAAEPAISKPLNLAFDDRGRLWVTDSLEYPYPVPLEETGRDTIRVLEDQDGDGSFEHVTTFADGLNIPIGLYPYGDGVICYSIPYIWRLRDTDGDGKCDRREKLLGPFDHTRDTHGMCNAFTRGFDGWLYACHGFNNQSTVAGADGHQVTMHSGNTFRFRLDGSRMEHHTYGQVNPFGLAYDARGDLLSADCHTKPVTLLLPGGFYQSFGKPHDGLGFVPDVMQHLHGSTAIGGIAISQGADFPHAYRNNTFGGNVMTSRINRNSLRYAGGSVRAQEEPDFLISGDSWFRPVDLQFGPDGALYVADFYNRIIGHYEVPLDHPGRDRHRGRIWRIHYGEGKRRAANTDLSVLKVNDLVARLEDANPVIAKLAADRLADTRPPGAVAAVRALLQSSRAQGCWQALWLLHRWDVLEPADLKLGLAHEDELVRVHTQRVLAAERSDDAFTRASIAEGLSDASALVNREAALAAAAHPTLELVSDLLAAASRADRADVHLAHALKLGLRGQLRHPASGRKVLREEEPSPAHVRLLAEVCLGLRGEVPAGFVLRHIEHLGSDREQLKTLLRYAAAGVRDTDIDKLVRFVRHSFATERGLQLELLTAVRLGLASSSSTFPKSVRGWAQDLATELLALEHAMTPLDWQQVPYPAGASAEPIWQISRRRRAAGSTRPVPLWSSFPAGEQKTGIFRSEPFTLPSHLSFFVAGHDGYPQNEPGRKNLVRMRDRETHQVIQAWAPPRNDVAQRMQADVSGWEGKQVYMELVDGDTAGAYAWLAVGQFSASRLNPSDLAQRRAQGAELVSQFSLVELRDGMLALLRRGDVDRTTRRNLAAAIARLQPTHSLAVLADILGSAGITPATERAALDALAAGRHDEAVIDAAMQQAASAQQQRLAELLAQDEPGVEVLVRACERGTASRQVLGVPSVSALWEAVASEPQRARISALTVDLADANEAAVKDLAARVADFLEHGGDVTRGRAAFEQHCATCHKIGGKGKEVGPNLDGIGGRGLQRLAEDILLPSRNVDRAFFASTVVLKDGRALTGLVRPETPRRLRITDARGEAILVSAEDVELVQEAKLSPMPNNLSAILEVQPFRDLMSFLLQVR